VNVLVVDDQPVNRKLLRVQLEAEGHSVREAPNGVVALEMLEEAPADLIISDILMPLMDGYRLCADIRASDRHRETPFIFYTATYTSPADKQLCFDLGGDAYLRKPLGADALAEAIDRVMTAPRRRPTVSVRQQDILKEYSERLVFKLEQKNLELAAASDRLRLQAAALDSAADAILITDVNGSISWANRAFSTLIGQPQDELVGCEVAALGLALPDSVFRGAFWEAHDAPVWRGELVLLAADGNRHSEELTVTPVRAHGGRATHLVGVLHDVTERRNAEERLRESDRRFRSVLTNLNLIAMMLDHEGRITYANDFLLRLTGWTLEEVLGRDWFEMFIPSESARDVESTFARLLSDVPDAWHHENEIKTRAGKKILIQWNNTVLRSASGDIIGTASIGLDVTRQRMQQEQMLRAQRLESLGTLAGGIAHDLNNLFMPILLGATMLRKLEPQERSLRAIENIERSVKRGSDLVKQVLLFARGAETSRQSIDLADVVRELGSIVRSTFPRDVSIDVVIGPERATVTGDPTQLSQVLLNLCVNARDAMPNGGQLSVATSVATVADRIARLHGADKGGTFFVVEVSDTGEGIPGEILDRIFDPFFTTKEIGKGTGLGLSTAQGIVTSHGGFLTVASTFGEGSTFAIYLPVAAPEPTPEPPLPEAAAVHGNGELIMVVDDDAAVLTVTRETLEAFGYRVLPAEGGAEAIGVFARRHTEVALVLTDMAMPIVDGHALIAALQGIDPAVRIVAATANTGTAQMAKLAKSGITGVLAKPYTADQLLRAIANAVPIE
jgi:PAS domain S-box-containing protein